MDDVEQRTRLMNYRIREAGRGMAFAAAYRKSALRDAIFAACRDRLVPMLAGEFSQVAGSLDLAARERVAAAWTDVIVAELKS